MARCVEANPDREVALDAPARSSFGGNPALLLRLVDDLLENARKYSSRPIQVRVIDSVYGGRIAIEDLGIRIDPCDLESVFEPFFLSDRSGARATAETGLGLALCRRVVEMQRGTIAVQSALGAATTVSVDLPSADR